MSVSDESSVGQPMREFWQQQMQWLDEGGAGLRRPMPRVRADRGGEGRPATPEEQPAVRGLAAAPPARQDAMAEVVARGVGRGRPNQGPPPPPAPVPPPERQDAGQPIAVTSLLFQWTVIAVCLAFLLRQGAGWLAPAVRAVQDWARVHHASRDLLLTVACVGALLFVTREYVQSLGALLWKQAPR